MRHQKGTSRKPKEALHITPSHLLRLWRFHQVQTHRQQNASLKGYFKETQTGTAYYPLSPAQALAVPPGANTQATKCVIKRVL
jgi:hypothetical protein